MQLETEKQALTYDFDAIVSGVGGSMGLFLGFSFLEMTLRASEWIRKTMKDRSSTVSATDIKKKFEMMTTWRT